MRIPLLLLAAVFLLVGIIGIFNIINRAGRISQYKKEGVHTNAVVESASVSYSKSGRNSYDRYDVIIVDMQVSGESLSTSLDEARYTTGKVQKGDPLEIVYLPQEVQKASDGHLFFFDDHKPVPATFLERKPFTEGYAVMIYSMLIAPVLLLFFVLRKKKRTVHRQEY